MIRRAVVLATAALAGVVGLSSCSTVSPPAASVNGREISLTDLEAAAIGFERLEGLSPEVGPETAPPDAALETSEPERTTLDAETARRMLSVMIRDRAFVQAAADAGRPVTDADRAAARASLEADDPRWSSYDPALQTLAVDATASRAAMEALPAATTAAIQAAYEQGAAGGILCVSHILVANETDARTVSDRLAAGEAFAAVAAAMSTDPGSGANGGALANSSTGGACYSTSEFASTFVPAFVAGSEAADVGVPTAPVKSDFGYHIILLRPYAEVADDAAAVYPLARQQLALTGADITVHPSIGQWVPALGSVVALDTSVPGDE